MRPVFVARDESGADGILADVFPFLAVTLAGTEEVIEKLDLPQRDGDASAPVQVFRRPLLPFAHEG